MPIVLFLLWLVYNERITVDVVITGILIVAVLTWFMSRFTGWSFKRDAAFAARIPAFIAFVIKLVVEMVIANIHMIALVLSDEPDANIRPRIVRHATPVKTSVGRVALANSITLTPGTITVDVKGDSVYVHAIDDRASASLEGSSLENKLVNMERGL